MGEWNIWVPRPACCAGACTSVLTPAQHWRFAARILKYPTPSQIFEQDKSGTKKILLAVFLLSVPKQINAYIKIFLFNYVYLRVTGTTRKLVLEHIIILLERMQTKVTLKLPKVWKHICLVVQWQGHPTIFSENYLFGRRFEIYRIIGSFPVKFLACLPLVRFSNIKKNGIIAHF